MFVLDPDYGSLIFSCEEVELDVRIYKGSIFKLSVKLYVLFFYSVVWVSSFLYHPGQIFKFENYIGNGSISCMNYLFSLSFRKYIRE